ncbi:MAG: hypothetical protein RSF67_06000 [Clostridia bacterium]
MLDKSGKETDAILAQKATTVTQRLLKTEELKLGKYHGLFDSMPLGTTPSQEFLKFISIGGEKGKKFPNLELLVNLERTHPNMFAKVIPNFDKAKEYRTTLDDTGKPTTISWEEALKKYFLSNKYVGITKSNVDIAELFGSKGLEQDVFDKAVNLRERAKLEKVKAHILDKPLREKSILESIEEIRNQTAEELADGKKTIEELYRKQFSYEWLSKHDPHNSIMGLFASCCGTITSSFYGKKIAEASVIADDVQNLVVRNSKGDIIAKGTMYVNKNNGYGVINDFELNGQYRNHESKSGRYTVEESSKEEQERELIFGAFQRGLKAFVKEYDIQNPDKPINQINIGMGYNRLKRQVERFEKSTKNLTVPAEYSFQDAMTKEQYILYERKEKSQLKETKSEGGPEL